MPSTALGEDSGALFSLRGSFQAAKWPLVAAGVLQEIQSLPIYHYSAYGNQISAYANLITSDISPEELRFRAYSEGRETGALAHYTASVAQLEQYYTEERAKLLNQQPQQPVHREREPQRHVALLASRVFPLPSLERDLQAFRMDLFPAFGILELPPAPEFCE